jgi:hypothetical protein
MWIRSVEVRGLRDLPGQRLDAEPGAVSIAGPDPASTALFDALELSFAAVAGASLLPLLRRVGAATAASEASAPGELNLLDPAGLRDWLAPGQQSLSVTLRLALDPQLHAKLRSAASADPRVALALADDPTLSLVVGAVATTDHSALAVSLQRLDLGAEALWAPEAERPRWQRALLSALGERLARAPGPDPLGALRAAQRGRAGFGAYTRWTSALLPAGPRLRLAEDADGAPLLLGDELPLRRFGAAALRRAELAAAAVLSGADVLLVEGDDPLLLPLLEGEGACLEQALCAAGGPPLQALAAPPGARQARALPFARSSA